MNSAYRQMRWESFLLSLYCINYAFINFIKTDSHTDEQTGSQTRTVTDAQIETGSACGDSMVDLSCSQTNVFSAMADVQVQPTRKRRWTEATQISTETYDVTDYRPTQDELMAVDDFMVLNDIIVDPTDERNCTVKTDDGQITTYDRIRQILDRNYEKSVENTMRKYNK